MITTRSTTRTLAAVLAALFMHFAAPRHDALAQDYPTTLSSYIAAGMTHYDFEQSGSAPFFSFLTNYVLSDLSAAEFGIGYARPEQPWGHSDLWVLDGQFQLRWPVGRFTPFVGMGAGIALDRPVGDVEVARRTDATFTIGAGVRAWLDDRTRVRTDLRYRGIGPTFDRTAFEWTIGLGWVW
jgi:hypothetical protein